MKLKPQSPYLIVLLSAFVALAPLATDMYLPALPGMVVVFNSNISLVQLTLSSYLAGFGIFHLFCGPLSDRFGRKPVLMLGMLVFFLASVACTQIETIRQLILWRFVQGVGACVGPTLGRAVVRDIYEASDAARAISTMSAIMALAPVLAPIIGGWMLLFWPWQSIFLFMAVYALFSMVLLSVFLPESLPAKQSLKPSVVIGNFSQLLGNRSYMLHMLATSSLYAGILSYVAGSSFVLIDFMQVPAEDFGLWFMLNVLGFVSGNIFMIRFSHAISAQRLMLAGGIVATVSGFVMVMLCYFEVYHPLAIVVPIGFFTFSYGVSVPSATARALLPFAHMAGTASALMGFVQVLFAALGGAVIGFFLKGSPMPMALVILLFGIIALLAILRILVTESKVQAL